MCRILLATDEPVLGEGLRSLLAGDCRFRLVSLVPDLEAIPDAATKVRAAILILDWNSSVSLGDVTLLDRSLPGCRIVLWVRELSTELAFQAIERGVRGILLKTASMDVLLQCLNIVSEGGFWVDDSLWNRVVSTSAFHLTPRESDLVTMLVQGMKNKEIATALYLTEPTVKVYLCKLYRKLGVKDRFELALYGLRNLAEARKRTENTRRGNGNPYPKPPADSPCLRSIVIEKPRWESSTQ